MQNLAGSASSGLAIRLGLQGLCVNAVGSLRNEDSLCSRPEPSSESSWRRLPGVCRADASMRRLLSRFCVLNSV